MLGTGIIQVVFSSMFFLLGQDECHSSSLGLCVFYICENLRPQNDDLTSDMYRLVKYDDSKQITLPETNSKFAPEKSMAASSPQKEAGLSSFPINFQGRTC